MDNSSIVPQINETQTLIPNLPNDVSALILSYIPFPFHDRLKSTCKSWRKFYSSKIPLSIRLSSLPFSSLSNLLCIFPQDPSLSSPFLFDPTHLAWVALPHMPINPHVYSLSNFASLAIGSSLYVLGGSLFDTRSFPMDRPTASSAVFRYDLGSRKWAQLSPMITPRGSLAVAAVGSGRIVVAGGGSRHTMFSAAGSRVGSVECYDIERDEWAPLVDLPGFRAGCAGFWVGQRREFWVMGGYGESRTINGVLPVDEYYKDAVVLELNNGGEEGNWREIGDMWDDEERTRLGKIVVIENDHDDEVEKSVFMLDGDDILRYNMVSNRWFKESTVPRKTQDGSPFGFVALEGELHVISLLQGVELSTVRRSRHRRRGTALFMQIYDPKKMSWRSLVTRTPFQCPLDFRTAVMCTVRV
ncbi:F-box/kelch-repeat protein OR23 [Amaranthus tricolor]|uniref:F-box/kelch-repeat protein OR23 n=1 Tax=Amaranthus tricolor TaxID=29722 RepID=UPI0025849BCF|nr:F-box/kelch-repeat protein OR23 [Amaranthus tricolor]